MMKRSVATAVALATLSMGSAHAAEDFQVGLSGFVNQAFTVQDVQNGSDKAGVRKEYDVTSVRADNLLQIDGETVLDNGLKVTAVAGFSLAMGNNQNDLYQEETYVGVGGSFGQVDLGRRRNAASLLHTFIPSAGLGTFAVDDARTNIFASGIGGMTTATSLGGAEYANRVMYFTPRIEGVQLAASFTPETDPNKRMADDRLDRYNGNFIQNEYSLAGNYVREFQGVGVSASAGYTAGEAPQGGASLLARDMEAIQGGLALSYMGFTLGGAYGQLKDPQFARGKDRRFGGGLKYENGPWTYGASYLRRNVTAGSDIILNGTGDDVSLVNLYEVAATYALGPGVKTGAGVYYNDNAYLGNRPGQPEDSIAGVVNLSVNF